MSSLTAGQTSVHMYTSRLPYKQSPVHRGQSVCLLRGPFFFFSSASTTEDLRVGGERLHLRPGHYSSSDAGPSRQSVLIGQVL